MNHKSFINNFYFPSPDWSNLPTGFPNLNKKGLTREEGLLLDGIKLAWMTSKGKNYLAKQIARKTAVTVVIIFTLFLGKNLVTGTDLGLTKSVSAKTVSTAVTNVVEATMSAVFRK